jgi:uridine kinase
VLIRPKIVAVCGGSGSGKTTLVNRLQAAVAAPGDSHLTVLQLDHYYLDLAHLTKAERDRRNFDQPEAFDYPLLTEHIAALASGEGINRPNYDFATHTRRGQHTRVEPARVVILDGILTLADPALRKLYDLSVFVDVHDDVRFIRRLRRDIAERGRTMESVIEQYMSTVKTMHDLHVAPQKFHADIIVSWMDYNDRAVGMLAGLVRDWLNC